MHLNLYHPFLHIVLTKYLGIYISPILKRICPFGVGICCLVLSTEAADRKWRGQVGQRGFFFFTAGFLSLSLINHLTRGHWRRHILLLSTVSAAISCILCIVLEGKSKADSNWPQLAIEAVGFTAASIAGNA
ncbi:hypothetical protein V6N11_038269 [Hibiscus sabdariffa]|uniref:Uncharacterized protein n=1 Tax=Hibiscus sabdariffa TaxID=183260 RepID=A0ABR2SK47_9ROSI